MSKVEEKIAELEERLEKTAPNKHTMKSIVYIKAQLSKLRQQLVEITSSKKGGGSGFGIKKTGDAQVAFIGFPSVGKSSLLNELTEGRTDSKVASYDFTTLTAIPGMMEIKGARIQLIDLPGIILGAAQGKGRGKEILGVVRTADLILIIICFQEDGKLNTEELDIIRQELYNVGIRLNKSPPRMEIRPRQKGGIGITSQVKQSVLDEDLIKTMMYEYKKRNAGVYLYEDLTPDEFIDGIQGNRNYIREFVIINKVDLASKEELRRVPQLLPDTDYVTVSALEKRNIDELRSEIFEKLELIRVYNRPPGKKADYNDPMVLKKHSTIEDVCIKIHKDFVRLYKYAQIWGPSSKHPGQRFIRMDHEMMDGDEITIILKK
ncbi:MAG: 50S ribosome-binding GTPase [Candidatus Lokiarchaeota archaeon]|nr:50S ribosome-binding GTPase [Candidatus Lokiarchaeota archaeon]